jgi:hypothetical protein
VIEGKYLLCYLSIIFCVGGLLRFESNLYPRRRNSRFMDFYHRTNYGQNEQVNKAILIFNEYCDFFGFRDDDSVCFS